jgi:hypothetical protein
MAETGAQDRIFDFFWLFSVIDSNGNYRTIGTTMSDASRTYALTWTPDISGNYKTIASFAGTESYYSSSAQTYFHASEGATAAPTAQPANMEPIQHYVMGIGVAIIVVIVIIGALIMLMLRKRP